MRGISLETLSEADWDQAIAGTLQSTLRLIRSALPHLRAGRDPAILIVLFGFGGVVFFEHAEVKSATEHRWSAVAWVNLLSIYALSNYPPHGTFSASKAGE